MQQNISLHAAKRLRLLPRGTFDERCLSCRQPAQIFRMRNVGCGSAGGGCDGVIAKRRDLPYQSGNRNGMQKIKRHRSADCVLGGFRYGENADAGQKARGLSLLGLYDADGLLHHGASHPGLKRRKSRHSRRSWKPSSPTAALLAKLPEVPAAGRANVRRSGFRLNRKSWSKFRTIISPKAGSAMAAAYCAGGPTRSQTNARWSSYNRNSGALSLFAAGRFTGQFNLALSGFFLFFYTELLSLIFVLGLVPPTLILDDAMIFLHTRANLRPPGCSCVLFCPVQASGRAPPPARV